MKKTKAIKIIKEYPNPYPQDIFEHTNQERMDIRRGRFNEFIYYVVENTRKDMIKLLMEEKEE